MEKAGVRLKKVRLDKGISLEEVAKHTKINLNILRSIEDEGFVNLDPIYVKGFVKMYCQFLGLNPADYIAEHKAPQVEMRVSDQAEQATTYLKPAEVKKPFISLRVVGMIAAAIVGLVCAFFLVKGLIAGAGALMKSYKKRPHAEIVAAAKKAPKQKSTAKQSTAPKQERKPVAPVVSVSSSSVPAAVSAGPVRLGIRAKDDCWVQVKIDGKTIFQGMLSRGRLESWQADSRIDLSLGNAGAVDLEINGNRIMPLGRKGQVVRDIRINQDGSLTTKDGMKLNR